MEFILRARRIIKGDWTHKGIIDEKCECYWGTIYDRYKKQKETQETVAMQRLPGFLDFKDLFPLDVVRVAYTIYCGGFYDFGTVFRYIICIISVYRRSCGQFEANTSSRTDNTFLHLLRSSIASFKCLIL